jgi:enoyl-CoA hydratase/carnithine racemase
MSSNSVNAINLEWITDLHDTLNELKQYNPDLPLYLTSPAPSKTFSAGLDLSAVLNNQHDIEFVKEFSQQLQTAFETFYLLPRPTIGILNGHCIAGGLMLALSCDYRVACKRNIEKENGTYCIKAVPLGMSVPPTLLHIIRSQLNSTVLFETLLTGRVYSVQEASKNGIVHEVVDVGDIPREQAHQMMLDHAMKTIDPTVCFAEWKKQTKQTKLDQMKATGEWNTLNEQFIQSVLRPETRTAIQSQMNAIKKK